MANKSYPKTSKCFYAAQGLLRLLTTAATGVATWIMLTNKQTVNVYGFNIDARYSYSSAFKFFAYANAAGAGCSVLSLLVVLLSSPWPGTYFCMFLHDMMISTLLMAGCAAATAVGFIGKYGNSHTGWTAICDNFATYCKKVTFAAMLSYVAVILYLILTVISVKKSRYVRH